MLRRPRPLLFLVLGALCVLRGQNLLLAADAPLNVVVMDPLALQLSCTCVEGTGQRRYDKLGEYLQQTLGRPVTVVHDEALSLAQRRLGDDQPVHLIIGKEAVVQFDADHEKLDVRSLAVLTGRDHRTTLSGVFLVRKDSPFHALTDLAGKKITLGPVEQADTHAAARAALEKAGLLDQVTLETAGSIDAAALALTDGETDAAVVSAFMPRLLEGCGKIEKGATRSLAETPPVPFITAFATSHLGPELEKPLRDALLALSENPETLDFMESANGFVAPHHDSPSLGERAGVRGKERPSTPSAPPSWPDWRGPHRAGYSPEIPRSLPDKPTTIWSAQLTGPAMAGVGIFGKYLVAPDKSADLKRDIFRCFDTKSGAPLWTIEYEAPDAVDYSNAPRAAPVIHEGDQLVYLQGALGDLLCVRLITGEILWRRNIFHDYGADLLTWGASSPPLLVDDLLVFTPGGPEASIVAVHRKTGETAWQTPGHAAAYSALIDFTGAGPRQIVGYDTGSLGGWDPKTGERTWEFIAPDNTDFNVTTPLVIDGDKLLLATENNATRLYRFDDTGKLDPEPVTVNDDLAPDTCSPVVVNNRIYATAYGELFCLELSEDRRELTTLWSEPNDMFYDHSNVIAGDDRVLVWTMSGDLLLIDASPGVTEYQVLTHWTPFSDGDDAQLDSMSHPTITPGRIYLRSKDTLLCLSLTPPPS